MRLQPLSPDHPPNPVSGSLTLDEILANVAHCNGPNPALSLSKPGSSLSWREVDGAVSALAQQFCDWRLGDDAVVGVQLGSSPEGALACLALWRAGLVPAMLPLAWRRRECIAALASVGASAILTVSHGGGAALGELACEIAAGLDAIRFVGCFGGDAPDGASPLDEVMRRPAERFVRPDRPDDAADHVAVVTFDAGRTPVARSHNELLAAALMPLVAGRLSEASSLVSTLDLASLSGLATGLVPWIMAGCAATFHQASTTERFAGALGAADATHLAIPGRLAQRLVEDGAIDPAALTALTLIWRGGDAPEPELDLTAATRVVDARFFGELGLYADIRDSGARPAPTPIGPAGPAGFPPLIKLKLSPEGRLAVRGAVCPAAHCPADPGTPKPVFDDEGFVDTGFAGVATGVAGHGSPDGGRRGVIEIGGLAFAVGDVEDAYRRCGVGAKPIAQDDPLFGSRITLETAAEAAPAQLESAADLLAAASFSPALAPVATIAAEVPEAVRRSA